MEVVCRRLKAEVIPGRALTFATLEVGDMSGSSTVSLKELIRSIACALVDNPDEVEVNEVTGDQTAVIELKVAKEDLGKVIGKKGRTAQAMRLILSAASTKIRKMTQLNIIE
jgi:hypothetical protein